MAHFGVVLCKAVLRRIVSERRTKEINFIERGIDCSPFGRKFFFNAASSSGGRVCSIKCTIGIIRKQRSSWLL